jgi:hypothetical protein
LERWFEVGEWREKRGMISGVNRIGDTFEYDICDEDGNDIEAGVDQSNIRIYVESSELLRSYNKEEGPPLRETSPEES